MKFYICSSDNHDFYCATSFKEAKEYIDNAKVADFSCIFWQIKVCDIAVNPENLCRILGNLGGYAKPIRVYDYSNEVTA